LYNILKNSGKHHPKKGPRNDDLFTDESYINLKRRKVELDVGQAEELKEQQREKHSLQVAVL
jgi:hypothetical protein